MSAAVQSRRSLGIFWGKKSWTTEDAMAMVAKRTAAEDNIGESNVCMPSGIPGDVKAPPQSVAVL